MALNGHQKETSHFGPFLENTLPQVWDERLARISLEVGSLIRHPMRRSRLDLEDARVRVLFV